MPAETVKTLTPKEIFWEILRVLENDSKEINKAELGRFGSWAMLSLIFAKPTQETGEKFFNFMEKGLGLCELKNQIASCFENILEEEKKLTGRHAALTEKNKELQKELAQEKADREERERALAALIEQVRNDSEDKINEIKGRLTKERKAREEMQNEFNNAIEEVEKKAKNNMEGQLKKLKKDLEDKIAGIESKN